MLPNSRKAVSPKARNHLAMAFLSRRFPEFRSRIWEPLPARARDRTPAGQPLPAFVPRSCGSPARGCMDSLSRKRIPFRAWKATGPSRKRVHQPPLRPTSRAIAWAGRAAPALRHDTALCFAVCALLRPVGGSSADPPLPLGGQTSSFRCNGRSRIWGPFCAIRYLAFGRSSFAGSGSSARKRVPLKLASPSWTASDLIRLSHSSGFSQVGTRLPPGKGHPRIGTPDPAGGIKPS